jgi:hypothetical protein
MDLSEFFKIWKETVMSKKYDRWCKENHNYIEEEFQKFIN